MNKIYSYVHTKIPKVISIILVKRLSAPLGWGVFERRRRNFEVARIDLALRKERIVTPKEDKKKGEERIKKEKRSYRKRKKRWEEVEDETKRKKKKQKKEKRRRKNERRDRRRKRKTERARLKK